MKLIKELSEKLIQSDSKEAFDKNVATEIKAGKDKKQAVAIAYSIQNKNKKKKLKEGRVMKLYKEAIETDNTSKWNDKIRTSENNEVEDDVREVLNPVMANTRRQMKKTHKIRDSHTDDAIKRIKDQKEGPVDNNPKRTEASKKMKLSESLFENDESDSKDYVVFTQESDDSGTTAWEMIEGDYALYGKDGKYGLIITGNRDFTSFWFVNENEDDIKEALGELDGKELLDRLKEITGKEYVEDSIIGYSQGDWQNIYYPKNEFSKDYLNEIGDTYFGKYTEFSDEYGQGYYVFDSDNRPAKEQLAEQAGIPVEKVKIRKISGSRTVYDYEEE